MKTYSLKTREEIRNAIEREFMISEMKDYASTLDSYFWEKAEAWYRLFDPTNKDYKRVDKYGLGRPYYEMTEALDAFRTVMEWQDRIDDMMEIVVTEIMANPIEVECDDDDEEGEMYMAWIGEMLNREMGLENKKSYEDVLGVHDVMGLYESTAGIDPYTKEEYHDLFMRYDCGL